MRMRSNSINGQKCINANQLVPAITSHKSVFRWSCCVCVSWLEVVILVQIQISFEFVYALPSDDESDDNIDGYLSD